MKRLLTALAIISFALNLSAQTLKVASGSKVPWLMRQQLKKSEVIQFFKKRNANYLITRENRMDFPDGSKAYNDYWLITTDLGWNITNKEKIKPFGVNKEIKPLSFRIIDNSLYVFFSYRNKLNKRRAYYGFRKSLSSKAERTVFLGQPQSKKSQLLVRYAAESNEFLITINENSKYLRAYRFDCKANFSSSVFTANLELVHALPSVCDESSRLLEEYIGSNGKVFRVFETDGSLKIETTFQNESASSTMITKSDFSDYNDAKIYQSSSNNYFLELTAGNKIEIYSISSSRESPKTKWLYSLNSKEMKLNSTSFSQPTVVKKDTTSVSKKLSNKTIYSELLDKYKDSMSEDEFKTLDSLRMEYDKMTRERPDFSSLNLLSNSSVDKLVLFTYFNPEDSSTIIVHETRRSTESRNFSMYGSYTTTSNSFSNLSITRIDKYGNDSTYILSAKSRSNKNPARKSLVRVDMTKNHIIISIIGETYIYSIEKTELSTLKVKDKALKEKLHLGYMLRNKNSYLIQVRNSFKKTKALVEFELIPSK